MSVPRAPRDVGQLLRQIRQTRGLSQARLAERANASQQWLSQVERGTVNPTLADLERYFAALGMRLRFEAVPVARANLEDPDLVIATVDEEREEVASIYSYALRTLAEVPMLVAGRIAALAHGLPVRVRRLDLLVTHTDRPRFAEALRRFHALRWNDRWQEFRDLIPAERPGPMRWLIGEAWELRVTLLDHLPDRVNVRFGHLDLPVPPLTWLLAHDPDVADLAARVREGES